MNRNLPGVSLRKRKCFLQFICLQWSVQLKRQTHVAKEMLFPTLPILPWLPEGWICSSISRDETGHPSPGPLQLGKQESGQPWHHLWAVQIDQFENLRLMYLPGLEGPDRIAGKGIVGHCLADTVSPRRAALVNSHSHHGSKHPFSHDRALQESQIPDTAFKCLKPHDSQLKGSRATYCHKMFLLPASFMVIGNHHGNNPNRERMVWFAATCLGDNPNWMTGNQFLKVSG